MILFHHHPESPAAADGSGDGFISSTAAEQHPSTLTRWWSRWWRWTAVLVAILVAMVGSTTLSERRFHSAIMRRTRGDMADSDEVKNNASTDASWKSSDALVDMREASLLDQLRVALSLLSEVRASAVKRVERVLFGDGSSMATFKNDTSAMKLKIVMCQLTILTRGGYDAHMTRVRNGSWSDTSMNGCETLSESLQVSLTRCGDISKRAGVTLLGDPKAPDGGLSDEAVAQLREVYVEQTWLKYAANELEGASTLFVPKRSYKLLGDRGPASSVELAERHKMAVFSLNVSLTSKSPAQLGRDTLCIPRAFTEMPVIDPTPSATRVSPKAGWSGRTLGINHSRHSPSNSTHDWTVQQLRVGFLSDLELFVDQHLLSFSNGTDIQLHTVCMRPKLRAALQLGRQHRWMLQYYRPPLIEDDILDALVDPHPDPDAASPQTQPQRPSVMEPPYFSASVNLKRQKKDPTRRDSSRNNPLFVRLRNVVLPTGPSYGGHLQGYGVGHSLETLRDERWIRIRKYFVKPRQLQPRFLVPHRLMFVIPVLFSSNNIGHVMFRYYSFLNLFELTKHKPESTFVLFLTLPSAALTMGKQSLYRAFSHGLQHGWSSVIGRGPVQQSVFDLCFTKGLTGFGGVSMFTRGNSPQHVTTRLHSQRRVAYGVGMLRTRSSECMQLPLGTAAKRVVEVPHSMPTEGGKVEPLLIVLIQRRRRRILNDEALLYEYVQAAITNRSRAGSALPIAADGALYVVDPVTHRPFRIAIATLEYLSLRQQADLVRQADVLVGSLGAGMCWMMYMRPRSVVLELQSSGVMWCTGYGINKNRNRCDYSKQSSAAFLNHIGFPLTVNQPCPPLFCDGNLTSHQFQALMAASLCSVGRSADEAQKVCSYIMPPSTVGANNARREEQFESGDDR